MKNLTYLLPLAVVGLLGLYGAYADIGVTTVVGPYPSSVSAGDLDLTWSNVTIARASFTTTGRELILLWNTLASDQTVTLESQADPFGRIADITATLNAGEYGAFWVGSKTGWATSGNFLWIRGESDNAVKAMALRIPN